MDARREFIHLCMARMGEAEANKALEAFDIILSRYNITPAETALTTFNPMDEPLLTYYLESQKLDGKKESTLRNKKGHIRDFLQSMSCPVGEITPPHCRAYMASVTERPGLKREKITAGTYNCIAGDINGFFDWLYREDIIQKNPFANIKRQKEIKELKRSLSAYELEKLRNAASDKLQDRLMIELYIETGVRISELRLLKTSDFDFHKGLVRIYGVKTSEYRQSIVTGKVEALLEMFLKARKNKSPYLFAPEKYPDRESPVTRRALEKRFVKLRDKAELSEDITPHTMRHTFATMQVGAGTGMYTVKQLMGHRSLNTTQQYIDANTIDFNEARRHSA